MNVAVPRQFDVAILGGGMSGLALACHLDERNAQGNQRIRKAVVLEPRTDYQRDKTWCYWQQLPGLFDQAITHTWSRWEVRSAGRRWVSTNAQTPYVRVDRALLRTRGGEARAVQYPCAESQHGRPDHSAS